MNVTKITDHVEAAKRRLMQQYKELPNMAAVLDCHSQQFQELEDAAFILESDCQLWNGEAYPAVGAQLDGLGQLVNVPRRGRSDSAYLLFILGEIAKNFSQTTTPEILAIVQLLFNPEWKLYFEMFPAEINFQVAGSTLDPDLYEAAGRLIQLAIGATIKLGSITDFDETSAFRFGSIGEDPRGGWGGFSSVAAPTAGGKFAGLIYTP